jgi:hypothetical protein
MTSIASTLGHIGTAIPSMTKVARRTTRTKWPTAISKNTTPATNEKVLWLMVSSINLRQ